MWFSVHCPELTCFIEGKGRRGSIRRWASIRQMNLNDEKTGRTGIERTYTVVAKDRRRSRPQITWNIWNNCRRILIKIPQYPKRINRFPRNKSGIYLHTLSHFPSPFCDSLHLSVRQVELKSAVDNEAGGGGRREEVGL